MKTEGLLYIGCQSGKLLSEENFLSKKELRKQFPNEDVILRIIYRKRRYARRGEQKTMKQKGKKKKGGYGLQREKTTWKHKLINVY